MGSKKLNNKQLNRLLYHMAKFVHYSALNNSKKALPVSFCAPQFKRCLDQ